MAERRMFAKTIVDSDAFLEMPLSTQALYFHLAMRADDDGFINNPKKIQRMVGASDDDCKLLLTKKFLLLFETGVIVIKHWKIHNYVQKDRYKETMYKEEKQQLKLNKNNAYTLSDTPCIHNVYKMDTQVRLGKDRLGKDSIEGGNPTEKYGKFKNVSLSDGEIEKLSKEYPQYKAYIDKLSCYMEATGRKYKSHYAMIVKWIEEDKANQPQGLCGTIDYELFEKMLNKEDV